jgi:hypothetical protein
VAVSPKQAKGGGIAEHCKNGERKFDAGISFQGTPDTALEHRSLMLGSLGSLVPDTTLGRGSLMLGVMPQITIRRRQKVPQGTNTRPAQCYR